MNEPEEIDIPPHPFMPCDEPTLIPTEEHCATHCGREWDDLIHHTEVAP
jgi:hypothetical protein